MGKNIYLIICLIISVLIGVGIGYLYTNSKHSDYDFQSRVNTITAPCIEASRQCSLKASLCSKEIDLGLSDGPACTAAQDACAHGSRVCTNVLSELDDLDYVYGIEK